MIHKMTLLYIYLNIDKLTLWLFVEGHLRVVQLLLSKGALLHRDNAGRTPLHLAAHGGHTEIISTLLSVWGHLLDQRDKDGVRF